MIKIVAICGARGSGKDTVASALFELNANNNIMVRKLSFGDPIKEITMPIFGLKTYGDYEAFKRGIITLHNKKEVYGKDIIRNLGLQLRGVNPSRFIEDVEYKIDRIKNDNPNENILIIISDLRFKEELKWCQKNGAKIIKVKRAVTQFDAYNYDLSQDIDDFFADYIVYNNDSETDLKKDMVNINKNILGIG